MDPLTTIIPEGFWEQEGILAQLQTVQIMESVGMHRPVESVDVKRVTARLPIVLIMEISKQSIPEVY